MEVWFHNLQTVVTPIAVCIIKGCQILNKKSKSTRAVRTLFDQIDFSSAQNSQNCCHQTRFLGSKVKIYRKCVCGRGSAWTRWGSL